MKSLILPLSLLGSLALGVLGPAGMGQAQIIPDATLPVNSSVTPGCTACVITGGTERGVNLYHSFQQFSIPTGGSAWFNNGSQIQNILTRVTGTSLSNIDGLIRANGTANLFLLNPHGITFGPNAGLEIGGSFLATTASSFKFADGSEFSATNPQAPPLLTVNVTPGVQFGAIASGSTITNRGALVARQDLTLDADNLDLQGQIGAGRNLTLQAQAGVTIRDTATAPFFAIANGDLLVQGNESVDIFALNHPISELVAGGAMTLRSASPVQGDAHYWSGSSFRIEQLNGELGTLVSPYDPVVRSQGDVTFRDYVGTSLHILAGGRVTAGSIIITGNDTIANTINPTTTPSLATVPLSNGSQVVINGNARPTLDIRAGMDPAAIGVPLGTSGYNPPFLSGFGASVLFGDNAVIFPSSPPPANVPTATGSDIAIDVILVNPPNGQILLTNQFRPNPSLPAGSITINSTSALGFGGIYTNSNVGRGGDVILDARGSIRLNGSVDVSSVPSLIPLALPPGNGGNVTLLAKGDIIPAANTSISSFGLLGGNITLNSGGAIVLSGNEIGSISDSAAPGVGGAISVAARSLTLTNNALIQAITQQQAQGGDITVVVPQISLQSNGQLFTLTTGQGQAGNLTIGADVIELAGTNPAGTSASSFGASSTGAGSAGTLTINTRQLIIRDGAQIGAGAFGSGNGGTVDITATELLQVTGQGSSQPSAVFTANDAESSGNSGNLRINTGQLLVQNNADVSASTSNAGTGGELSIVARRVIVENGGKIDASTKGSGRGGNININATESIQVTGQSPSRSSRITTASTESTGDAGDLTLRTRRLTIQGGAQIDTATFGSGQGGNLFVTADQVDAIGTAPDGQFTSGLFVQTSGAGKGGLLSINANQLTVRDGAQLNSGTFNRGEGGNVAIAADTIQLIGEGARAPSGIFSAANSVSTGNAGGIQIQTRQLTIQKGALLNSDTDGKGNAGNISVSARDGSITVTDRGAITAETSSDTGRGGNITLDTNYLQVTNGATVSAATSATSAGGNIIVNAEALEANQGGRLRTTTSGSGRAGDMILNLGDRLILSDLGTGLFANTTLGSSGAGGNIVIAPRLVLIQNGAEIAVGSKGSGTGGNIFLPTGRLELRDRGSITAETASAQGGNITLKVSDLVLLRRNSLISATAGTAQAGGNGGNVTISTPFVIGVLTEDSDIRANAFSGNGGKVTINANQVFGLRPQPQNTPFSDITASSQLGISGTIILNTLNLDPSQGLQDLNLTPIDPSKLVAQGCNSGRKVVAGQSKFVILGRGGLSASPDDPFGGTAVLNDLGSPTPSGPTAIQPSPPPQAKVPTPIIEAQSWVKGGDGKIYLVNSAIRSPVAGTPSPPLQCQGL